MNFYAWIKKGLVASIAMENDEKLFYRHRDRFNELIRAGKADSKESAELFYYMNRTAYNGLCRFNSHGEFNTPFGKYKRISYARSFTPYREAFADWAFVTGDFAALELQPDDFVYADPPYDVEFTAYSQGGFSWSDQVRTAETFAQHRGPVVWSIRRHSGSRRCIASSGTRSSTTTHHVASAAPAIARRPEKSSRRETCKAQHE